MGGAEGSLKHDVITDDVITGEPDPAQISTSQVERLNLTTRMSVRRFTRLTTRSARVENQAAAMALHSGAAGTRSGRGRFQADPLPAPAP
jgi:hypothetical protein